MVNSKSISNLIYIHKTILYSEGENGDIALSQDCMQFEGLRKAILYSEGENGDIAGLYAI